MSFAQRIRPALLIALFGATLACPSDGYETNLDFLGGDLVAGDVVDSDSTVTPDGGTTIDLFTPDQIQPPKDEGKDSWTGPECGNSKCEDGENNENCPEDCKDPVLECLELKCGEETAACFANEGCVEVVECTTQCPDEDDGCFMGCVQQSGWDAGGLFFALLECGQGSGCFEQGPEPGSCGNGKCDPGESKENCPEDCSGFPDPVCGNDKCEPGESKESCPEDCSNIPDPDCGNDKCEPGETQDSCPQDCGGTDPEFECILDNCPGQLENCLADSGCESLVGCLQDCGDDEFCEFMCFQNADENAQELISALGECMEANGCSEPGPGPGNDSCEGRCGESDENASCQCDFFCQFTGSCCDDYEQFCGEEPPNPQDGSCEGRCGEYDPEASCQCDIICLVNQNCCDDYQDVCGTGTQCILDECELGNCLNYSGCTNAVECMGECSSESCVEDCLDDAPGGAQSFLNNNGITECVKDTCLDGNGSGSSGNTGNGTPTNPTNETLQCLLDNCEDAYNACLQESQCAASLTCMEQCGANDTECAGACAQQAGFGGAAINLGICGFQNSCVDFGGGGGFGGGNGGGFGGF